MARDCAGLAISFLLGRHGKGRVRYCEESRYGRSQCDGFRLHGSRRGDPHQTGFCRGGFQTRPYGDIAVKLVRYRAGRVGFHAMFGANRKHIGRDIWT